MLSPAALAAMSMGMFPMSMMHMPFMHVSFAGMGMWIFMPMSI